MSEKHNLNDSSDPHTTFSCVTCKRPNAVDNLVACDRCHNWWHYSCAGVDDSIADRDWLCPRCIPPPPVSKSLSVSSSSTRRARAELSLQRLAEKKELEKKQLELEIERRYMEEKYRLMEQTLADEDEEYRSIQSHLTLKNQLGRQKEVNDWVDKSIRMCGTATKRIDEPANVFCQAKRMEQEGAVGGSRNSVAKAQQDAPSTQPKQIGQSLANVIYPAKGVEQEGAVGGGHSSVPKAQQDAPSTQPKQIGQFPWERYQTQPLSQQLQELQLTEMQLPFKDNILPAVFPSFDVSKGAIPKQRSNEIIDPSRPVWDFKQPRFCAPLERKMHEELKFRSQTVPTQPGMQLGVTQTRTVPNWEAVLAEQQRTIAHSNLQPHTTKRVERPEPGHTEFPPQLLLSRLTPEQLAARQVLPRDLPTFTGNPADWPVFISNYNYTTEACGYSDGENMIWLQRCLKGVAWESVRSRLILPASVPHVIAALRMRYGRPELLIESLTERVKTSPSPKADRLETIIEFGTMVQALCDHVIAADSLDHLANPSLLKDLVTKLPAEYHMKWASFKRNRTTVDLKTFAAFMEEIVTDAYSVSSYAGPVTLDQRGKAKQDRSLVHTIDSCEDEEDEKVDASETCKEERPTKFECSVCGKEGHKARECWTFKSLSVDDRWRKIQSLNLCRTCLFGHSRRACRSTMRCGIDGCQLQHHPLLHTTSKSPAPANQEQSVNHYIHQALSPLLFRIVPVTLYNGTTSIKTFALLDEGSSLTMIEDSLAAKLGVDGYNQPISLKWTASMTRRETNSRRVAFEISGLGEKKRFQLKDVGTIESLDLPTQSLPFDELTERYHHLRGLPVESYSEVTPQLLIGLDNLRLAVPLRAREGGVDEPIAVKTRLGWCVYGGGHTSDALCLFHLCEYNNDQPMNQTVLPAFDYEEAIQTSTAAVAKTEKKTPGLPWEYDNITFPVRFSMDIRQFQCLKQDMEATIIHKNEVTARKELLSGDPRHTCYLLYPIWDALAKVDTVSLGLRKLDHPDSLLLVGVGNNDRRRQQFVEHISDVLVEAKTTSSSATAQHVRRRNVLLLSDRFPRAAKAIVYNHSVNVCSKDFKEGNEAMRPVEAVQEIQNHGVFDEESDDRKTLKGVWEAIQTQLDRFWGRVDGAVRQAEVQMAGVFRRPVSKMAVLKLMDSGETLSNGGFHGGENVAARIDVLAALSD